MGERLKVQSDGDLNEILSELAKKRRQPPPPPRRRNSKACNGWYSGNEKQTKIIIMDGDEKILRKIVMGEI